jgi:tape measure domain-containing protein
MSMINSRLALVTSSSSELVSVQKELLQISNQSRVGLQGTSDLYAQLARSTQALGLESSYLLDVTETISQTLTISGASAQSANAALFQLSQGLSAGALRGEELNSVLEQTPRLAQALADGMGVSIGQLRQLGSEGALTAEKVLTALHNQAQAVNSEFKNIAVTAEGGYTVLQNMISDTVSKLNEQHDITETIGNVFVALGKTISTQTVGAFDDLSESGLNFGEVVGTSVAETIKLAGSLYDTFESIGDVFSIIKNSGEVAFWGLSYVISSVADTIANMFENVINGIISGFNMIPGVPTISPVNLRGGSEQNAAYSKVKMLEASERLSTSTSDLFTSGGGREKAEDFANSFYEAFKNISSTSGGASTPLNPTIIDVTTPKQIEKAVEPIDKLVKDVIDAKEPIKETNEGIKDILDTFYNDDDSFYEVINDTSDTIEDFSDTASTLNNALSTATTSLNDFVFQFTNSFISSLQSNSNSLMSIANQNVLNTLTYDDALQSALQAQDDLIANPISATIGEAYTSAFNTFVNTATTYLDPSNFASMEEFRFAQSTYGAQVGSLQSTALAGANVLDSMNNLLSGINDALADGVLTSEESIALTGLSGELNTKNEQLLGNSGVKGATNTVANFVSSLRGGKSSGIAISDIYSSVPQLQVATGLESPISSLNSTTSSVSSGVGTSNSRLSSIDSKVGKIKKTIGSTTIIRDAEGRINKEIETTQFQYYAKGGFTGFGMGKRDHTGKKQAGIVHEDEWVAPEWMLKQNPELFQQMESVRRRGSFADGGYTTPSFNVNASLNGGEFKQMQNDIRDLKIIMQQVTENGNAMNVALVG